MGKEETVEEIKEFGDVVLGNIYLLNIIGEIEGHENLNSASKTTKYEHLIPKLAQIEASKDIKGVLMVVNTIGGDVSAGLALAELIATISKPVVALVLGDCHSIGVPLAVAADYSFIVKTGTMIIHPVRLTGTILGAPQTYEYFKVIQDRIVGFIGEKRKLSRKRIEKMMLKAGILSKDLGTILVGKQCVDEGLIDEVGGISQAYQHLKKMIK